MSTATIDPAVGRTPGGRPAPAPIPFARVMSVELTKMFNTRSGFWLMASIGIAAVLATAGVILFAPDSELTYDTFAGAIGFPMTIILPIIAVLSVTGEWTQRSGLTTFTLIPHRSRVIGAKALVSVAIGVISILVAFAIGAVGNLLGTTITGTDRVWDVPLSEVGYITLANVLGLLVGFMLGVLIRNSAGAIVAYFVYAFVIPTLAMVLANTQDWFARLQPWADFNFAQGQLYSGSMTGEQWAHLSTAGLIWLAAPLAIGLWMVRRAEVK